MKPYLKQTKKHINKQSTPPPPKKKQKNKTKDRCMGKYILYLESSNY